MIADFIGGPWHLQTKPIRTQPLINSAGDQLTLVERWIAVPIRPEPRPAQFALCDKIVKVEIEVCHYQLVILTPTFCVYVDTSAQASWKNPKTDISDPVRYYFAREDRFREEIKGWTHHNADFTAASAEGVRGMLAIQRFRKRKT